MATDPAVQARDEIIRAADRTLKNWETYDDDGHLWTAAEAVVAAVTPLIRRQAFTEAADAIEAQVNSQHFVELLHSPIRMLKHLAALVRGLGEETENA